jgi:hypothetical protein
VTALTSFDELAEGTSLGIQVGRDIQTWRYGLAGLSQVGPVDSEELPLELFFGYLRDGLIFLHDDRPPRVGEWFTGRASQRFTLAVTRVDEGTGMCSVAMLMENLWHGCRDYSTAELTSRWRRCDPPQINPPVLVDILRELSDKQREVTRLNDNERKLTLIRDELHGIQTYLERAQRRVNAPA